MSSYGKIKPYPKATKEQEEYMKRVAETNASRGPNIFQQRMQVRYNSSRRRQRQRGEHCKQRDAKKSRFSRLEKDKHIEMLDNLSNVVRPVEDLCQELSNDLSAIDVHRGKIQAALHDERSFDESVQMIQEKWGGIEPQLQKALQLWKNMQDYLEKVKKM